MTPTTNKKSDTSTGSLDTGGAERCTCRAGRDFDGSEFGPCGFCERAAFEDEQQRALLWDAMRWRFTQRPGYGVDYSYEFSEVERNLVAVFSNRKLAGCGLDLSSAIDSALYLETEGDEDVLAFWRKCFRSQWDGARWVTPEPPTFYLNEAGQVCTANEADGGA